MIEVLGVENGNFADAILIEETKAMSKDVSENMRNFRSSSYTKRTRGLDLSLAASCNDIFYKQ